MGLTTATIRLANGIDSGRARVGELDEAKVRSVTIESMVDTGAYLLCINENIRNQIGVPTIRRHEAEFADGSLRLVDIVGPIEVTFENRGTTCEAMVMPGDSQVLLGAIPLEGMDVCVDPKRQRLIVNPLNPYVARHVVK